MDANILIVEDNEDLCLVLADNLKKAGHRVTIETGYSNTYFLKQPPTK